VRAGLGERTWGHPLNSPLTKSVARLSRGRADGTPPSVPTVCPVRYVAESRRCVPAVGLFACLGGGVGKVLAVVPDLDEEISSVRKVAHSFTRGRLPQIAAERSVPASFLAR
jgi:hypothetical protein